MKNLELKAFCPNLTEALQTAHQLPKNRHEVLYQKDIYFEIPSGRLKLRIINDSETQLIFYHRPDITSEEKVSDYQILSLPNALLSEQFFCTIFNPLVTVEKVRQVFFMDNARIHLDDVTNLGSYIEFEVVLNGEKPSSSDLLLFQKLKSIFQIKSENEIQFSYLDLLKKRNTNQI